MSIPSLFNTYIDETYQRLVQVTGSGTEFADGLGNPITFGQTPTGSLLTTASVVSNTITFTKGDGTTFPITVNTGSGGGPTTPTFPYTGSAIISGSLVVTGSTTSTLGFTGSLQGTASWANNALTASYVTGSIFTSTNLALSASYALTSSYASYANVATQTSDIVITVLNQTGAQINKGIVVRITGSSNSSDIPRIGVADYTNDNYSANTIGLVLANIANGETGSVMTEGTFLGYDTDTPGWTSGQLVFLGANGSITGSAPKAPLHAVRLGQIIRHQSNNGSLYIRIDNGYELDELHDVLITSAVPGNMLVKSGSVWINSNQLTGSYGLTGSLTFSSGGITGSLQGTASWASNALTSSYITSSNVVGTVTSASYAATASFAPEYVLNSVTSSFITTGSASSTQAISGTLNITGSLNVTGSSTIRSTVSTGTVFQVVSGSSTILYAGTNISQTRVGIRTSSPLYSFDVNGNANFTPEEHSGYLRISPGQSSTWNNPTFFQTSFGSTLMLNNSYYTASSGQFVRVVNGYAAGIQLEPSLGGIELFTAPYGNAGTSFASFTSRISITNDGSVGINNTSPSYSLDVSGSGNYTNGLTVTGSLNAPNITGSLQGTSSWATNFVSASNYVLNSATSSFVTNSQTSSFVLNSQTSSFVTNSQTSSFVQNSQTSSFVTNSQTSSFVQNSQTSSFVTTSSFNSWTGSTTSQFAGTSSYTTTASYALNGGVTSINVAGGGISINQSTGNVTITSTGGSSGAGSNVSASFTNQSTWTFAHSLGNRAVVIQTYDTSWNQIIPQSVTLTDTLTATITFPSNQSGFAVASVGGTTAITNAVSASYAATASYVNTLNQNVTIIPLPSSTPGVGLVISGSNTKGGTGYLDFLQITNTSASIANPNKYFRLNTAGDIEILRSDYNAAMLYLTNGGILGIGGGNAAASTNQDASTNYISFNNNNSQIYDDGNFHIHSRTSGQSMWINTNGGQLNLLTQIPVNGGASGSGVSIGAPGTLTGYVTINNGRTFTDSRAYGYLTTGGAGTYPGGSQSVTVSLYAANRIWGQEIDAFSDERMKDIQGEVTLEDGLKLVKNLKPIKYTWKEGSDTGLKVGYSAQQVSKAGFDHLISLVPKEGLEETVDDDGFVSPKDTQFSMNYDQVTPYHGVVIKYLLEKIEQLEQEIKDLKK